MNPSYCRIRLPLTPAVERFAAWNQLPQVGPLTATDSGTAIRLATDKRGDWRGNAVFVSDLGEWTLFQALSNVFGVMPGEEWAKFAGSDELIFAGCNDAIGYGELVVVSGGSVVREFFDYAGAPEECYNNGTWESETDRFETWVDIADFVDSDELGFCETGWLWVW